MVSDHGLHRKRGTVQGKILAASRHTKLFCGVQSPLQSPESTSSDNIVVEISKLSLSYRIFYSLSNEIMLLRLCFEMMGGREKA